MDVAKRDYLKAKKEYHFHGKNVNGNYFLCFWTYPFGHIYGDHPSGSSWDGMCIFCGKETHYDE
jgi:hypothetical protein